MNFGDSAIIENEFGNYGLKWEYCETKGNLNFSYSIIKCDNQQIKLRVLQILKDKKHEEKIAINRKFVNTKNIYPNKSTFLTETEDDVIELPKCKCIMTIPHRIEDELILLINGKHINIDMKLPTKII